MKPKTDWFAAFCWLALLALLILAGGLVESEYLPDRPPYAQPDR
jgi:hypothetical protein